MRVFGTLRMRFALLYAGAFALSGLVLLSVAFFSTKQTVHAVGASAGPPVTTHPLAGGAVAVAVSLCVLVLLSVAFGWLLAGRLLRPVRLITATSRDISASNLSRRLHLGRRDDEFTRLGETLNDLFARLEASFAAQRHFVANASHELRTPLTAERTVLQVALADPEATAGTLRAACDGVLRLGDERMRHQDGHGLGLAIVQAIARAHDAGLTAHAQPRGGLRVTVTFPATRVDGACP